MYFGEMVMEAGIMEVVIQRMQSLHAELHDLPFENTQMTPVLSEHTTMSASW